MNVSFLLRSKINGEFFCSLQHYGFNKVLSVPVLFGATEFKKEEAFLFLSENKEHLSDFEVVCRTFDHSVFVFDEKTPDHLVRVMGEKNALDEKISALKEFLSKDKIDGVDYDILEKQLEVMNDYSDILSKRLKG